MKAEGPSGQAPFGPPAGTQDPNKVGSSAGGYGLAATPTKPPTAVHNASRGDDTVANACTTRQGKKGLRRRSVVFGTAMAIGRDCRKKKRWSSLILMKKES